MTILKNVLLSLTIAPLVISVAFATGGNDPIKGFDISVKEPTVSPTNIERHIPIKENRVIKRRDAKSMVGSENKHLEHDEVESECYRQLKYRYDNNITIFKIDKACLKIKDEGPAEMYRPPASPDDFTEYSPTE